MFTRRDFLKASSLMALAPTVPSFLARTARAVTAERDGRILVVIQLDGGNDGINTVVPFADEGYAKHRKTLRLAKDQLVKISDSVGLHASLRPAAKLLEAGQLAIVQGVSYPNPNRSHFESMAIWHSARLDREDRVGLGWLGRALDQDSSPTEAASSMFVGAGALPVALRGRRSVASVLERPEEFALSSSADVRKLIDKETKLPHAEMGGIPSGDLAAFVERSMLDAYATADRLADLGNVAISTDRYPDSGLGQHLQTVARLIKAGFGTRIYYTAQSGYDTHNAQLRTHSDLLFNLSAALKAFLDDLTATKLADRVAVLIFSEFGRTVAENGSAGTDHGTAGPVFLAGPGIKSGLMGATHSLLDLDPKHGDLKTSTDFRQLYASVLEDWLRLPAEPALGGKFAKLRLFREG
ncbi:MAG TPA: DUF1501 domain-containing protein [Gemmataceae bacterium]|jgi:uncharacterized protein (DUF1501 family)|nr:DUF1501 domain-containing protein [Gemmataceae bacterium]